MSSPMFCTVADVRAYATLNAQTQDGVTRFSDDTLASNIRAASEHLEKATHRYFASRTGVTLTYTTNGDAIVSVPGIRSITSVALAGVTLTVNETYWLIPDTQQSGVYTAIQLRGFTRREGPWWLSVPDWFDRNLDSPYYPGNWGSGYGSAPNDLVIVADVGYADANLPESLRLATKALATFYTKHPDALLSGGVTTPDGQFFDLSAMPIEASGFIREWKIDMAPMAVAL